MIGVQILININDCRCQIASLKILKDISQSRPISRSLTDLGAIQSLIGLLSSTVPDLQCLSAETIANIAKLTRARRLVRKDGGIAKFVSLMNIPSNANIDVLKEDKQAVELLRCAALGLCSLSKSKKNKRVRKFYCNILDNYIRTWLTNSIGKMATFMKFSTFLSNYLNRVS